MEPKGAAQFWAKLDERFVVEKAKALSNVFPVRMWAGCPHPAGIDAG